MNRELKIGISASLISSLIVIIFIQPILSFLWRLILTVGGTLHQGYVDRIYRNAARAGGNPYGEATLYFLVAVFLMIIVLWTLESAKAGPVAGYLPGLIKFMERSTLLTILMCVTVGLLRLAIFEGTAAVAESFTQRLTVLAPAISDSEYKILKAGWANMRGEADYDALVGAMDKRAAELGVNLPPVP